MDKAALARNTVPLPISLTLVMTLITTVKQLVHRCGKSQNRYRYTQETRDHCELMVTWNNLTYHASDATTLVCGVSGSKKRHNLLMVNRAALYG